MTASATLADRYAIAKAQLDAAEAALKALRKEILATGQETVYGDHFNVTVALSERSSLDQSAVKALLTEAQITDCTKTLLVETLRVKAAIPVAA